MEGWGLPLNPLTEKKVRGAFFCAFYFCRGKKNKQSRGKKAYRVLVRISGEPPPKGGGRDGGDKKWCGIGVGNAAFVMGTRCLVGAHLFASWC